MSFRKVLRVRAGGLAAAIAGIVLGLSLGASAAQAVMICSGDVSAVGTFCSLQNGTAIDVAVGGATADNTNGALEINGGSVLTTPSPSPFGTIADRPGSTGTATVTGSGSAWRLDGVFAEPEEERFGGSLNVGRRGDGTLHVLDGGAVEIGAGATGRSTDLAIGGTSTGGGTGTVLIDGEGSRISVVCGASCTTADDAPGINVGRRGVGTMTVRNDGLLFLDGFGATLTIARGEELGADPALGTLNVDDGQVVINSDAADSALHIGRRVGDQGFATLVNGSVLTVTGATTPRIFVGRDGTGELNVLSGSSVLIQGSSATDADLDAGIQISQDGNGDDAAGAGSLLVDDATVTVEAGNAFINVGTVGLGEMTVRNGAIVNVEGGDGFGFVGVGREGDGTLVIESGGQVNVTSASDDKSVFVAQGAGSVGTLIVDGAGSSLDAGNILGVGLDFDLATSGGTGTVSVRDGGVIRAAETYIGANGFLGGNGTIGGSIFNLGGTVGPGLSPGVLTIDGDYVQDAGVLLIEIAGLLPGQFDVLVVDGVAEFTGGSILFSFLDDFLPKAGDAIEFLVADAIVGLENVSLQYAGAGPGFQFQLLGGPGGLSFVAINDATSVPEPATILLLAAGLAGLVVARRRVPERFRGELR